MLILTELKGREWESRNLILTETHDLETMLVRSPALDRVLIEFGSQDKVKGFEVNIRNVLVAAAIPIGCLRLHSQRTELKLKFQGLRYTSCIDPQSLTINRRSLVQEVKNRSQRPELSFDDLEREIRTLEQSVQDHWQLCSGDDLVSILVVGLRRLFGATTSTNQVNSEVLCRSLRLAYHDDDFANSQLIEDIRGWTRRNPRFRILR